MAFTTSNAPLRTSPEQKVAVPMNPALEFACIFCPSGNIMVQTGTVLAGAVCGFFGCLGQSKPQLAHPFSWAAFPLRGQERSISLSCEAQAGTAKGQP
jgi:hypothetical protein